MVSRVGNTTLYSCDLLRDWNLTGTYHQTNKQTNKQTKTNSKMMEVILLQYIRRSELPSLTRPSVIEDVEPVELSSTGGLGNVNGCDTFRRQLDLKQ